ncbi:hypothetical protein MKZ23_11095 [Paenibacillus sp. FSL R5-0876]|uniref:hypothetical protein n=1 Tax=Paenibacillus sp. FSL R5-0876 TaxID=2921661 RepID=UPI0030F7009B
MRMKVRCINCHEQGRVDEHDFVLTDSLSYVFTCNSGHKNVFLLNNHRYELLFQMGLNAYNDGYFREAVTNFAAAIERFHEFSIAVLSWEHSKGKLLIEGDSGSFSYDVIDNDFEDEYKKAWKELARQTERQLGAYIMLYLASFKRHPILISNKWVTFRNEIVHKGVFPDQEKAIGYAKETFDYIKGKLLELKTEYPNSIQQVYSKEIEEYKKENSDIYNGATLVRYTTFVAFCASDSIDNITGLDFDDELDQSFQYLKLSKE